jgi:hypothetical protein
LVLTIFIAILAALCAADAMVRGCLFLRSRTAGSPELLPHAAERPLAIVPARAEGERVAATIASVRGAKVLLLLDGADPEAETAARALGAEVVMKEPAGPTKAAALAWLAREHRATIEAAGSVLLLDVGSRLAPTFFDHFAWPADADSLQAYLHGGEGGAADSERTAQADEDRGREAFGWNVRLRGTGSAFRARTFLDVVPRLDTRVEDLEASLLLYRAKIRMAPREAVVFDEKPPSIHDAGSQRARWLVGRYELLFRRATTFAAHIAHRPDEGVAFFVEIFGRPLSLTVPLRVAGGAFLIWRGFTIAGAIIAATTLIDVALFTGRTSLRGALRLAASWLVAAAMIPKALRRWTRVRR